jgi:Ty3 transposon capsid-like protein
LGSRRLNSDKFLANLSNENLNFCIKELKTAVEGEISTQMIKLLCKTREEKEEYSTSSKNKLFDKINKLHTFSGDKKDWFEFANQLDTQFQMNLYSSKEKILFVKSYLRGYASEWATRFIQNSHNDLMGESEGYQYFFEALKTEFSDSRRTERSQYKIERIKMLGNYLEYKQKFMLLEQKTKASDRQYKS